MTPASNRCGGRVRFHSQELIRNPASAWSPRRTGIAPDVHMDTQKPGSAPTQYDSSLKGCLPFILVTVLLCIAGVAVVIGFNVFGPSGH